MNNNEGTIDNKVKQDNKPTLTPRERSIMDLVAQGLTNAQIAGQLYYSPATIKRDIRSAYGKLGAENRAEAVRMYIKRENEIQD